MVQRDRLGLRRSPGRVPRGEAAATASSGADAAQQPQRRVIGRIGTVARTVVGLALVVIALAVERPNVDDALLGLIVLPAGATLLLALRGRAAPPLRLGAAGHLVTIVLVVALSFAFPPATVLLFYGSAMLLAAATGNGACEVTALSNWLRDRDDQIGCPLFAPFDALDGRSACAADEHDGRAC